MQAFGIGEAHITDELLITTSLLALLLTAVRDSCKFQLPAHLTSGSLPGILAKRGDE